MTLLLSFTKFHLEVLQFRAIYAFIQVFSKCAQVRPRSSDRIKILSKVLVKAVVQDRFENFKQTLTLVYFSNKVIF